ncbi:MAG: PglZ domain-containing protein [Methylococcales bacterium]|nr:PglZ domain-containing protein [Methylococcales bacterium]
MSVQFVFDPFNIDADEALTAHYDKVDSLRNTINQHLKSDTNDVLRVRFSSKAVFNSFGYFEGLDGVFPTQYLIPRVVYRHLVQQNLPSWLSDELIIQLALLNKIPEDLTDLSLIDIIVMSVDAGLMVKDFVCFSQALLNQSNAFWVIFKESEVKSYFITYLKHEFNLSEELSERFIHDLLQSESVPAFIASLAYEQHQELLRKNISKFHLNIALPARSLSTLLLELPLLELSEARAKDLPVKCIEAIERSYRLVDKGELEVMVLAELVIAPWPLVLMRLNELVQNNISYISDELISKLAEFDDELVNQYAVEFSGILDRSKFGVLSQSSTMSEVHKWSQGYFDFIRQQFLSEQAVDNTLNLSFSHWLLAQSARIARSESDWRQFSTRVDKYLEKGYLVVVCMVDALSALNQDLLLESASKVNHLSLGSETLFSPLPTLTEVGKMALITGKETSKLPSDKEMAIRQVYGQYLPEQDSLRVVKSWQESKKEHIKEETNLLVFFENRIDERLHDCVDFEKHRKDVSLVLRQLMESVERWSKDAAYLHRDVVFLITADHGMTVTRSKYQGDKLGDTKERVFSVPCDYGQEPEGFAFINSGGKKSYLVPKERVGLTDDALLTHGGLTPEEVLIPFVTLSSKHAEAGVTPLMVNILSDKCQRINDKSWQIEAELVADVFVENIKWKFKFPLIGEASTTAMSKGESRRLLLNFSSDNEQVGMIELAIELSYDREGAHEVNSKVFSCFLPEPLISIDSATQGFEGMF